MVIKSILGATCACLAVVSFSANAALVGRLAATPGGTDYQAYYDTEADLSWLADANYALTSGYADANILGRMLSHHAMTWASSLNIDGVTGWRLPETIDVGNDGATFTNIYEGVDYGYNITTHSEMSNMFYNVLGNTAHYDTSGVETGCHVAPNYCLTNTGPFSKLQPWNYWSGTEYAPDTNKTWIFVMDLGRQAFGSSASYHAWAVHDGDVGEAVVPIPAAVWLFGTGLLGLVGVARRKKSV